MSLQSLNEIVDGGRMYNLDKCSFSDLEGRTIVDVLGLENGSDRVYFKCSDGFIMLLAHIQDCCEEVELEEYWISSLDDIVGHKVISAEERTEDGDDDNGSSTWTFYDIQTDKGYLQLRWLGRSNGYYSEAVDCLVVPE